MDSMNLGASVLRCFVKDKNDWMLIIMYTSDYLSIFKTQKNIRVLSRKIYEIFLYGYTLEIHENVNMSLCLLILHSFYENI